MKLRIILFIAFLIGYFLISLPYYSGDIKNHLAWGKSLWEFGTWGFYDRIFPGFSYPTYPPLVMGFFGLSYGLFLGVQNLVNYLNSVLTIFPSKLVWFFQWENTKIAFLKLPGIFAIILASYLLLDLAKLFKDELKIKKPLWVALAFLLNPAIIYLSCIWGQTDVLQFYFLILGFYLLFKNKKFSSFIFSAVALLAKQTALMLWLVYLLVVLKKNGVKDLLKALAVSLAIFYLSYLPFHEPSFFWPIRFYQANFTLVNFELSENAINLWAFLYNFGPSDSNMRFLDIKMDIWSYVIFATLMIPITWRFFFKKVNFEILFYYLFLTAIIYFFVLTRMHERYLIPAVILGGVMLYFGKKYWINYIFFSILFLLNLYRGLFQPDIPVLTSLVKAIVFLKILVIFYGAFIIYNIFSFFKLKENHAG